MCSFNALNCYLLENNASPYQNKLYWNMIIDFLGTAVWLDKLKTFCHVTQNTKQMDKTELSHR